MSTPSSFWVYIGAADGIHLYRLNPAIGKLEAQGLASPVAAGFMAIAPNNRFLYAVASMADEAGPGVESVVAFALDPVTGKLALLNSQPAQGEDPCFVTVDPQGRNVLVANYGSATVGVFPLDPGGFLQPASCVVRQTGSSVDPDRQQHAYAHSVNIDAGGCFAFVADLGADKVFVYRFDSTAGKLTANDPPSVASQPGSGPRHLTFDARGKYAYVINELSGTVAVYSYQPEMGVLTEVQTLSALPADFRGINTSAEIQLHPSGRFLYVSNRTETNFLTIFSVDPSTGMLKLIGYQPTLGQIPRAFCIEPTGNILVAANQGSNTIVAFRIDAKSGLLNAVGDLLPAPAPTCVKFVAKEGTSER